MSMHNVAKITMEYLEGLGPILDAKPRSEFKTEEEYLKYCFQKGYFVLYGKDLKVFLYPEQIGLRITAIPTNRKYIIPEDTKIFYKNVGELLIKSQPTKSNPEIIIGIKEDILSVSKISNVLDFYYEFASDVLAEAEKKYI